MVKKKIEKPRREVSKHQLSRWQQQKKRQRIIFGVGIFIIVVVLAVLGVGWYLNEYKPLHEIVIKVNDTEFNMNYYIERLEIYGAGQSIFYLYGVAEDVEESILQEELIRQSAMGLGISISDEEIDEKLGDSDYSDIQAFRDAVGGQLLIDKLLEGHFEHEVPVSAEQRHVMAMLLESEQQANEVSARLAAGEDFAELAGELSLESFTRGKEGDLDWRIEDVLALMLGSSIPSEYAFGSDVGVLSEPLLDEETDKNLGYWFVQVVERLEEPEQAHIFVILVGDEEKARQVKEKLDAGESFESLAREFSVHAESKDSGGDLSWVTVGMMTTAVDEFVFDYDIEMGTVSEPIRDEETTTPVGYWLVKVLDVDEDREIEENDRELLKAIALDDWVSSLRDRPETAVATGYMDEAQRRWAADKAYQQLY